MVREGFEAALVVAIVLLYLKKVDRWDARWEVWLGVAAAVICSIATGLVVRASVGSLEGDARLRAFAAIGLVATGVLTWMIFWMRRQSRHIKGDLESRADQALSNSEGMRWGLVLVAFVAVVREGLEAALFLIAAATEDSGLDVITGALIGLAIAVVLAFLVYSGGRSLPMRSFFKVTGLVLIIFAAGLVSRSVMWLQLTGDLGSFNLNGVYDVRSVEWLTPSSEIGRALGGLFGWDPRPSIEQVVAWLAYLLPVTVLFLRAPRRTEEPTTPAETARAQRDASASPA